MRISDWSSDVCSSDLASPGSPPAYDRFRSGSAEFRLRSAPCWACSLHLFLLHPLRTLDNHVLVRAERGDGPVQRQLFDFQVATASLNHDEPDNRDDDTDVQGGHSGRYELR